MALFSIIAAIALLAAAIIGPENFGSYIFLATAVLSSGIAVIYKE